MKLLPDSLTGDGDADGTDRWSAEPSGRRRFRDDRRGVSKALSYVLGIAIITLLLSGLIIATSNVVEDASDRGTEAELQVAGDQLAGTIMEVDRAANGNGETTVTVRSSVQQRAGGTQYRIYVDPTDEKLVLESTSKDVTVEVPVQVHSTLKNRTVVSGNIYVALRYDASGNPEIYVVTEDELSSL